MSNQPVKVQVWGKGEKIDLTHLKFMLAELKPIEFHIKLDGDLEDKPSLCIVLSDSLGRTICGQISFAMAEPLFTIIDAIRRGEY